MKFYLASKYSRMEELRGYRDELTSLGHTVTSSWLEDDPAGCDESDPTNARLAECANQNLEDILSADLMVLFTGGPQSPGRNIEFGYAVGQSIPVRIVGPRESVFHHLGRVIGVHADWADFLEVLR